MDFDALIHRFRAPLTGLLAGLGLGWGDAQDVAQDVFVAAYLGQEAYRGPADDPVRVGRWLRGIARNKVREFRRAQGRSRASEDLAPEQLAAPQAPGGADPAHAALRRAIDALPEKLRTVVYMHHLEETGVGEVAGLLGISARAVEGRLYRARAQLRDHLQPAPTVEGRAS